MDCTIYLAKTMALISLAVSLFSHMQNVGFLMKRLICICPSARNLRLFLKKYLTNIANHFKISFALNASLNCNIELQKKLFFYMILSYYVF